MSQKSEIKKLWRENLPSVIILIISLFVIIGIYLLKERKQSEFEKLAIALNSSQITMKIKPIEIGRDEEGYLFIKMEDTEEAREFQQSMLLYQDNNINSFDRETKK